jgi:hypothetical protein
MDNGPKVWRTGFTGAPVVGVNYEADISSNSSHGIKQVKIIQRLFASNVPPKGA